MSVKEVDLYDSPEARSALTQTLIDNARSTLAEVAELTGLDVAVVTDKYSRLFEDRGWMTERMEERLLLIELGDLLKDSKKRLSSVEDKDYASVARVVLSSMTLMANRFDARKKLVEEDINEITRANARQFGEAYDIALRHITDGLRTLHPEITAQEVSELSKEGLLKAKARLERQVRQ